VGCSVLNAKKNKNLAYLPNGFDLDNDKNVELSGMLASPLGGQATLPI
jgi:hypothetical protein